MEIIVLSHTFLELNHSEGDVKEAGGVGRGGGERERKGAGEGQHLLP